MPTKTINVFPGYKFENGENLYRGTNIGKGGYIVSKPGMYGNVALLDVASLHPHSIVAMNCFGEYTGRFKELLDARIAIKHKDFNAAKKMLGGKLARYLDDESTAADLAQALKIAINSVYGLTAANFDNPFRDVRNKNNIVALRGALFMRTLQDEVEQQGFTIVAIKTDSIKIADATPEIIRFCMNFANQYSYTFEHEATYERICQVNDADYVAKYASVEQCTALYGKAYVESNKDTLKENKKHPGEWTVTGAKFAVPYVFKKLFSHEEITFEDMCETKSVTSALYLDMNENLPAVSEYEKEYKELAGYLSTTSGDGGQYARFNELEKLIEQGHNYVFVGKVGQFCPIKPGHNGGLLLREVIDKKTGAKSYAAATGAKGYRWLESEMVKQLGKEDGIDRSYYDAMVDEAVHDISQYGDFEWFVSDDPYVQPNPSEDIPPWEIPGEPWQEEASVAFDVR